jgi:hypothetical protein
MTKKRAGTLAIGPLSTGGQGRHYQPPPLVLDTPTRVTNASSKGTYSQAQEWKNSALRTSCQDFLRCPSRGDGC